MPVGIKSIKITTELYNPYPTYTEVYKNKLDERDPSIFFTISGEPFDVDLNVFDVTISITIDDIIITDNNTEIAAQALDSDKKGIVVELSALDVELFAGLMKIELTLTNSAGDNVPVSPIMINITPSILDNASATPESIGSVADMLQLYPDLKSFVDNGVGTSNIQDNAITEVKIKDGEVTESKLATAVRNKLNASKVKYFVDDETEYTAVQLADTDFTKYDTIYYIRLASNVLYTGQAAGFYVKLYNVNDTQYFEAEQGKGIYQRVYTQGSGFGSITNPVADLQTTVGTLNDQLETALNGGGS